MLMESSPATQTKPRVWDLPVRVMHWSLVSCFLIAWLTYGARSIDLHAAAGYCALALVMMRVIWGFVGTKHARFADFAYTPRAALNYLVEARRGTARHFTGHNPAGSWSVYAQLLVMAAVTLSGAVAIAGMYSLGPLPIRLSPAGAEMVREIHLWISWALLALIGVHVAGAIWGSFVHRENFVAAMFSGRKTVYEQDQAEAPRRAAMAGAVVAVVVLIAASWVGLSGWLDGYQKHQANAAPDKVIMGAWERECSSCHLAYSPALLPMRSWRRMLHEQDAHFGEDLFLREVKIRELLAEAGSVAAPSWAAWKLGQAAAPDASPQRISELGFWREVHSKLPETAYQAPISAGRHDCEACHRDGHSGIFHPRMIYNPPR